MNKQGAKAAKRGRGEGGLIQIGESKTWFMLYRHHGRQFKRSSGEVVKQKAAIKLQNLLKELRDTGTPPADPSKLHYADLRKLYMQDYRDEENNSLLTNQETGEEYVCALKHLDTFFEGFRVHEITTAAINKFKEKRKAEGASNATVNRALAALRRMFNLGIEEGQVKTAPVIKYLFELKNTSPRQGFLDVADYENLSTALPPHVRPILATGFYTGMRLGEILGLRWFQVSIAENKITLSAEDTKSGEARIIPLIDGLPKMLENIRRKHPNADYVFLGESGEPVVAFIKSWRKACVASGMKTKLNGIEVVSHFSKGPDCCSYCEIQQVKAGKYVGLIFHDLRRSAIRNLTQAGVPRSLAMKISGHATEAIFERYNISTEADVHDAGAQVSEYLAKQRKAAKAANPMKNKLAIAQ